MAINAIYLRHFKSDQKTSAVDYLESIAFARSQVLLCGSLTQLKLFCGIACHFRFSAVCFDYPDKNSVQQNLFKSNQVFDSMKFGDMDTALIGLTL